MRDTLGFEVPPGTRAVLSSETMRNVRPVEVAADAVVVFERAGEPRLGAIVEIQRAPPDRDKRRAWPGYVVLLQRELDCPCVLRVIALDDAVASACARPIGTGHPGFVLTPLVVGRDIVPAITDLSTAIGDIELAVLSAVAHANSELALEVALPTVHALDALRSVDVERRAVYLDLVLGAVPAAARAVLEAVMSSKYEYQSDFAKHYIGLGKQEGRAEGEVWGEARALLRVLAARGFAVDPETEDRVRGCHDVTLLERWVTRAVTAATLADVFADG